MAYHPHYDVSPQPDDSWPTYDPPYGQPQQSYPQQSYPPYPMYPAQPMYPAPSTAPAYASTAPAYACAALFLACALQSFVLAVTTWDSSSNPYVLAAVIGLLFSGTITGNIDFAISATMTVACSTTTFALVLFARLGFIRWILAGIGGLVTLYYVVALLYLLANGAGQYMAWPAVALLLWAAATVVAVLPATGRAMRRTAPHPPIPQ